MAQFPNAAHLSLVPDDRRERAREQKRRRFLGAASRIIDREGLSGVTMQGVADELDCAVGTIYLYFSSKAALIAALQAEAIDTLRASYETAQPGWDAFLEAEDLDDELTSLVRLCAFGAHWVSASVVFADEFQLQRALLSDRVPLSAVDEVREVLPVLQRLLGHPMALLARAAELRVLEEADTQERALLWLASLNGVLLLDHLAAVDRHLFRAQHLGRVLSHDLLTGWGADRADVEVAASHVDRLAALGPLAPPPSGPGFE